MNTGRKIRDQVRRHIDSTIRRSLSGRDDFHTKGVGTGIMIKFKKNIKRSSPHDASKPPILINQYTEPMETLTHAVENKQTR